MISKLIEFQAALDKFLSYAKDLPGQVAMLEGKVENLQMRKTVAEQELQNQLIKNQELLQLEKEKVKLALIRAQKLSVQAHESLLALEKQRLNVVVPTNGHINITEEKQAIENTKAQIKRISEEISIPV